MILALKGPQGHKPNTFEIRVTVQNCVVGPRQEGKYVLPCMPTRSTGTAACSCAEDCAARAKAQ